MALILILPHIAIDGTVRILIMRETKKITIYEIARLAETSPRTVTRAFQKGSPINEETRERIIRIANENGYSPNQAASRIRGRELTIGVVYRNQVDVFTSEYLRGFRNAENALKDFKTRVVYKLAESDAEASAHFEKLIHDNVDGIVNFSSFNVDEDARVLLEKSRIPCITACFESNINSVSSVSVDTELKGRMACSMLSLICPQGDIAVFTGSLETSHHIAIMEGFRDEATKCGVRISDVFDTKDDEAAALGFAEKLAKEGRCKGVAFTSANSVSAIEVFQSYGYQPVIIASDVFPSLSEYIRNGVVAATIYQAPEKQGRVAIMNMYRYLSEKETIPAQIRIPPQIVLRSNLSVYEK